MISAGIVAVPAAVVVALLLAAPDLLAAGQGVTLLRFLTHPYL